jgi:pimeloyl-ACP methyl ester carboxylesterase
MFWRRRDICGWIAAMLLSCAVEAAPAAASGRAVTFTSPDGTPLVGMYYEASPRPAPAVVLVHMLGRSKDEWSLLAARLADAGISALAVDLRGHGRSGGNGSELTAMAADVQAAVAWISGQSGVRPGAVAIVGASLGANLAGIVAAESPAVRGAALISPSLEYRNVRLDAATMKKFGDRPLWLAASRDDPYAWRTVKELAADHPQRELRTSDVRGHGTLLVNADPELARALVDWLKRTLID